MRKKMAAAARGRDRANRRQGWRFLRRSAPDLQATRLGWPVHPASPRRGRIDHDPTVVTVRRQPAECARCGRVSGPYWWRWRAYRLERPGAGEEPELAIYCQTCANRT